MPWMDELNGGQVAQVRATDQAFAHYLLVNPNDIVWQAQIDDTKDGENYGLFEWNNEQSGVRANVMSGMVCLITTSTTDFSSPIVRGRVRLVPGATTFFINEESVDLDNTMYVTVFDDFDIVERLARVAEDGTKYKDYQVAWEKLPPTIDGLQSVYADLSGAATVSWSFTPTATAQASGAAVDSWLWDVGDGTITGGGVDTDQNITVSFPNTSEHRWVHLTVTDDNNNSLTFHFEVYTVALASATAVKLDTGSFSLTGNLVDGYNATIEAWDGCSLTEVYDQTRCAIISVDNYGGADTPIVSNIMMVGRLRTENSHTEGHEQQGVTEDGQFTIEGFATQLAGVVAQPVYIIDAATPADWGQIVNPNPTRAIAYFLIWHTTFLTLSSFSSDDFSAFTGSDWSLGENSAVEHINQQAMTVNAQMFFAPSGECTVRRLANYTPSGSRGALTTVLDFTTADTVVFDFPIEYGKNVGEVEAGGVVYNTTIDDTTLKYIARAPAQSFGAGYESALLNGQQLTANASDADARTEIAQRSADHLAYKNPKARVTATFMDGYWWMIPNLYQRFTFTFTVTDSVRGRMYTVGEYWQLVNISYAPSNEVGGRPVSATFERETTGANAGILVARVPDINALDFSLPPFGAYNDFPDDPLINYPDNFPDEDLYSGGDFGPEPPGNNNSSAIGQEILEVPMYSDRFDATTNIAQFGETYLIIVEGDGFVGGGESREYKFDESSWQFVASEGSYQGDGWTTEDKYVGVALGYMRRAIIYRDFSPAIPTVTRIRYDFDYTQDPNHPVGRAALQAATIYTISGAGGQTVLDKSFAETQPRTSWEWNGTKNAVTRIRVSLASSSRATCPDDDCYFGEALITRLILDAEGNARGDAFYKNYNLDQLTSDTTTQRYGAGEGLLLNGAQPVGVGSYMGSHRYEFLEVGNNAKFTFRFQDSDYTDNDRNKIKITVIGPGMSSQVI